MALDTSTLITTLTNMFTSWEPTAPAAATGWANAIAAHAATGQANGVAAAVPPTATSAMQAALSTQFAIVPGTPASVASAIATALDAFWILVVFAGMIAPPVPAAGHPVLVIALTAIFSAVGGTAASKANSIGTAIATYVNAVLVTFPPGTPFPVI